MIADATRQRQGVITDRVRSVVSRAFACVTRADRDLRRNDRLDALDSLREARRHIEQAERDITQTLPETLR